MNEVKTIMNAARGLLTKPIPKDSNLLLIGLSQNGKSLLGNYLIHGKPSKIPFQPGDGSESMTKHPDLYVAQASSEEWDGDKLVNKFEFNIGIIDTPGLSDSEDRDLTNMIRLMKFIQNKRIGSVILVINYEKRFYDKTFFNNIDFYKRLIPDLFNRNLLIIFTNVSMAQDKIEYRLFQEIDIDKQLESEVMGLSKALNIPMPSYYHIDSMPFSSNGKLHSSSVREFILNRTGLSEQLEINILQIPKLPKMIEYSNQEIDKLNVKVTGYIDGLTQAEVKLKEILNEKKGQLENIRAKKQDILRMRALLTQQSSNEMKFLSEVKLRDETWSLVGWVITNYDSGKLPFIIRQSPLISANACYKYEVTGGIGFNLEVGKVSSRFLRGLMGSIIFYTYNSDFYQSENIILTKKIETSGNELNRMSDDLKISTNSEKDLKVEIGKFNSYIGDINDTINKYKSDFFQFNDINEYAKVYNLTDDEIDFE